MTGVPFDHRDPGTPEPDWATLLAGLPPLELPGPHDHLVVVAAHPDDETLGAGGLIAAAAARGARVTVLVASDGEASHPDSPTRSPAGLAAVRRAEAAAAVAALAPAARLRLLGLPDGRLAEHVPALAAAIDSAADGCTHLVTPWTGDRHPDHAACARAAATSLAARRARHWQYPIWAWHWGRPDSDDLPAARLAAVPLDADARAAKVRALACHRSQHQPLSAAQGDEALLGPGMLAHFGRPIEVFVVESAVPAGYFEQLYEQALDPWGLGDRFYEQRKRAALLAALPRPRFRRAFEPGCAIGLLTRELAPRCAELVAWDVAGPAVAQAAARVADAPHVRVEQRAIPDDWPAGRFDLVVLSEVGYYCTDLGALAARVDASLTGDGVLVGCHWRHAAAMHPRRAEDVHTALGAGRKLVVDHVEDDFLLQVWTETGESVARAEGIVR